LAEGSDKRLSTQYLRPNIQPIYHNAVAAGGGVVKEAAVAPWGYFGYFSDPDGYLWKVASAS
jgi:uncharacterized protein